MVVGITIATITLVSLGFGLGFGLANGAPLSSTEFPQDMSLTSYERAIKILEAAPVIDG